jgi:GNAT superfamily N-acetyltransferase
VARRLWRLLRREVGRELRRTLPEVLPGPGRRQTGPGPECWLSIRHGRAVGLLVLGHGRQVAQVSWETGQVQLLGAPERQSWTVVGAWVVPDLRRRGVARDLLEAAAREQGVGAEALGYRPPFSGPGRAWARAVSGGSAYVITALRGRMGRSRLRRHAPACSCLPATDSYCSHRSSEA